jgi:hypothetical protein
VVKSRRMGEEYGMYGRDEKYEYVPALVEKPEMKGPLGRLSIHGRI